MHDFTPFPPDNNRDSPKGEGGSSTSCSHLGETGKGVLNKRREQLKRDLLRVIILFLLMIFDI